MRRTVTTLQDGPYDEVYTPNMEGLWSVFASWEGDYIRIEKGFVKSFRDQLELNVGSRGKIVIVSRKKF